MITNITLTNFRGFDKEISVRFRPITVLIGRNSAGKSSLVKFLLMLQQTLESQRSEFFVPDGRYVQLGEWRDLKNSRSGNRSLEFMVHIETTDIPNTLIRQVWQHLTKHGVVTETGQQVRFVMDVHSPEMTSASQLASFMVSGKIPYSPQSKRATQEIVGAIDGQKVFSKKATNLDTMGFLRFSRSTDSLNDLFETIIAEQFLDRLRYEFTSIRHLSPVREESLRTIQSGSPPPSDVGNRGEYAIPHLVQIFRDENQRDKADFIQRFALEVADVDKISLESRMKNLAIQVKARNPETGSMNYLADFGFGVSQCLPIFVQGAMQEPGQLLVVEQPEAQLHPTAQLKLGTFFAELWKERKVPSLIETHSANMLLRIRHLVSDHKLLPTDVSIGYFTVENHKVVVKNLDINEDGSMAKGLPMEFFGADVIEAIEMGA